MLSPVSNSSDANEEQTSEKRRAAQLEAQSSLLTDHKAWKVCSGLIGKHQLLLLLEMSSRIGLYPPLVYLEDQDYIHLVSCHIPTGVSGSPQVPRKYWLDKWLRSEGPLRPAFICLLVLKSLCAHFSLFPPHFGSWEGAVDSWVGTGGGF